MNLFTMLIIPANAETLFRNRVVGDGAGAVCTGPNTELTECGFMRLLR